MEPATIDRIQRMIDDEAAGRTWPTPQVTDWQYDVQVSARVPAAGAPLPNGEGCARTGRRCRTRSSTAGALRILAVRPATATQMSHYEHLAAPRDSS